MNSKNVTTAAAILLAAGRGERLGSAVPKQFLDLGGIPLFMHSLRLFDSLPFISEIILVTPEAGLPASIDDFSEMNHPLRLATGGPRRQDSVANGLAAITLPCDVALVHDTARPFPPPAAIELLLIETKRHGGGLLAARATDTVKRAAPDQTVAQTLDRSQIWLAQTPQAIRADLIPRAIAAFRDPHFTVTDEASLLESWGVCVALVESPDTNFKITAPADLSRAAACLHTPAPLPAIPASRPL